MRRPWGGHYPSHCYKGQEDEAGPVHSARDWVTDRDPLKDYAPLQPLKHMCKIGAIEILLVTAFAALIPKINC